MPKPEVSLSRLVHVSNEIPMYIHMFPASVNMTEIVEL